MVVQEQFNWRITPQSHQMNFLRLLERSGIRQHRMKGLSSLAGVRAAILDLARAVGATDKAGPLVARYDATLRDLERRLAGAPRKRVLYWAGGMTAGGDTAIGALIEGAGAINVGREMGVQGIAPPGAERAFVTDPDVVLVGTWPLAVESLSQSTNRQPDNPNYLYHLALAYHQNGDNAKARTHLEKALKSGNFEGAAEARKLLESIKG